MNPIWKVFWPYSTAYLVFSAAAPSYRQLEILATTVESSVEFGEVRFWGLKRSFSPVPSQSLTAGLCRCATFSPGWSGLFPYPYAPFVSWEASSMFADYGMLSNMPSALRMNRCIDLHKFLIHSCTIHPCPTRLESENVHTTAGDFPSWHVSRILSRIRCIISERKHMEQHEADLSTSKGILEALYGECRNGTVQSNSLCLSNLPSECFGRCVALR